MSSFLIELISAQYKVTLQISVFTILFLRHPFFSILPLVILSSWKRFKLILSHCYPGAPILGAEGRRAVPSTGSAVKLTDRDSQILGRGSPGGSQLGGRCPVSKKLIK